MATNVDSWMSCKSNGWLKGDKCRSVGCPGATIKGDYHTCGAEIFKILIKGSLSGSALENGDIVRLKNPSMGECVRNHNSPKVDVDKCSSGETYWKINKLG